MLTISQLLQVCFSLASFFFLLHFVEMCVSYNIFSRCCILLKHVMHHLYYQIGFQFVKVQFFWLNCISFFGIIVQCFCCASVLHSQICCQHMHSLSVMFIMKDHNDFYLFFTCASQFSIYCISLKHGMHHCLFTLCYSSSKCNFISTLTSFLSFFFFWVPNHFYLFIYLY